MPVDMNGFYCDYVIMAIR